MTELFPPHIQCLGIVSPAGFTNDQQTVQRGAERLKQAGVTLAYPTQQPNHQRFLSSSDEERALQLHDLLCNPKIDALLALKGGYGCARLLHLVDWERLRSRNLPFIGYSDLTAFHLTALKHGCKSHIYGPMLASTFGRPTDTQDEKRAYQLTMQSFSNLLHRDSNLITFGQNDIQILQAGQAKAPLVPATLSVLCSLIGTPYLPDLTGHILAVEDINEPAHRIDGYLNHLRNAGILRKLAGLVFGTFTDAEDGEYIPEILSETTADVKGPVITNLPFGHCFPALSLPIGTAVVLHASRKTISLHALWQ